MLLFTWLVALIFSFDANLETYHSLQMSSNNAGTDSYAFNPYTIAGNTGKEYTMELEILKSQNVTIESSGKTEILNRGDVISVTVPSSSLDGKINPNEVNLEAVLKRANIIQQGKEPFGGYRNEVDIVGSKNENLLSESTKLRLALMAKNKELKVKNIELDEETDSDEQIAEAGVCATGDCQQEDEQNGVLDIFNRFVLKSKSDSFTDHGYNGPKTLAEVVESYQSSDTVKDMLRTAKNGYSAVRKRGSRVVRRTSVSSNRKSGSIGACYNGVKELLQKSGVTPRRLVGEHAKNAGASLNKQGFLNLLKTDYKNKIKSPYDAPVGAIIVYGGGASGHIEVRTATGFISDYNSPNARTGSAKAGLSGKGRRVIGVYIKETLEVKNYLAYQESLRRGNKNEI